MIAAIRRGYTVKLNLILAACWAIAGLYVLLFLPADYVMPGLLPLSRNMLVVIAMSLCGYNLVRWRLTRVRLQVDEETDAMDRARRDHHRRPPPNPDFDFSDPKPGGGPPDPTPPRSS